MAISSAKFKKAVINNPPNWLVSFVFRYFSVDTAHSDMKVRNSITFSMLALFVVGLISTAFKLPKKIIGIVTVLFLVLLLCLFILISIGVIMNNIRIKRIMKELNINKLEYNILLALYL